jgi:hypothetical protein
MAKTFQARGDWRLEESASGARLVIPTRPVWPVALFLTVWLGGWTMGEVFAARQLLFGSEPWFAKGFLLFWLTGWTVGGAVAWAFFLGACGLARETVWRDGPDLCVRWGVWGLGWTTRYAATAMGPLVAPERVAEQSRPPTGGGGLVVAPDEGPLRPGRAGSLSGALYRAGGLSPGVRFSYFGSEKSVGAGLDEGQAARLAEVMALRFGLRVQK